MGVDLRKTELVDKIAYPGTLDADRYGRELRRLIRQELSSVRGDSVVALLLKGLLHEVSRSKPIADNRALAIRTLDFAALHAGAVWRTGPCTCYDDAMIFCTATEHGADLS